MLRSLDMVLAVNYGTVSDIELVWILSNSLGLLFSSWCIKDARKDRRALDVKRIRNGRRLIANFAIRSEAMRATVLLLFLLVGIMSAFLPDVGTNAHVPHIYTLFGAAFRWTFLLCSWIISAKSVDSFITRRKLLKEDPYE
jgi:hypothetical protein